MSICLTPVEDVIPTPGLPKIKEVRAFVSRATEYGASDVHDTADTHWIKVWGVVNGDQCDQCSKREPYSNNSFTYRMTLVFGHDPQDQPAVRP